MDGTMAFCMLLKRLSYPNRLVDLARFFNYSSQSISQTLTATTTFLLENHGHLLNYLNTHQWLNKNRYQLYAQSIANMGEAVQNCWGFIDQNKLKSYFSEIQEEDDDIWPEFPEGFMETMDAIEEMIDIGVI
ncbi:hypothetical protein RN001_002936 [Aquatica leii]|uniref:DDE Tnp4 domain-containing protein n=1 Tax=Aquatica leii TaxID=1421715 RepID=A0AAN7SSX7_9COLE|nr:hypothetical protein RN001_002936 [Aquatica leii]